MKLHAYLIAIPMLLNNTFASAIESNQWVITGIGADSCASYVLALSENRPTAAITMEGKTFYTTANAYTQWINGFLTAMNATGKPGQGQIQVDVNGIALWVKNYCEANPSESIVMGAGAFIRAHRQEVSEQKPNPSLKRDALKRAP
jgi:hypothetical protein